MTADTKTETRDGAPRSRAASVQTIVSPGGIKAWLVEDYAVPLVALEFALMGGASQDPQDKPGVATITVTLTDGGGSEARSAFSTIGRTRSKKY